MKRETILWLALAILTIVLMIMTQRGCSKDKSIKDYKYTVQHLEDTMKSYRRKDSAQVSSIAVLQTSKLGDFLALRSKDSVVIRLQNLLKDSKSDLKNGGSATVISGNTNINTSTPTVIYERDTVQVDQMIYMYPEYQSEFKLGKWVSGNTVANRDTTTISLSIYDEYDVIIGRGNRPVATVIGHNPYNTVKSVKTYQVSMPPPKRFSIGIQAGYGAYYYNKEVKLAPYLGVGLSYNLVRF